MIETKDQEELFKLIANYLNRDIICIAIGGTAMMFAGYKTATKDIDLVFKSEQDRQAFVKAIEQLGYKERSLAQVYDEKRRQYINTPKIFTRGDERFDLFVKNVFGFELEFSLDKITQRQDFLGKKEFKVYILPKEELILLKAITGRDKDYEDIETILTIEKNINWKHIINEAVKQKSNNLWILIGLEETLRKLKKITFIPEKYFKMIYRTEE